MLFRCGYKVMVLKAANKYSLEKTLLPEKTLYVFTKSFQ